MKIPEIKKLVEGFSTRELIKAEEALVNEEIPEILIGGADEGEQLTHVFAAIFIKEKMEKELLDFKTALREFTGKVRESIS